jgi:hypothetical protein
MPILKSRELSKLVLLQQKTSPRRKINASTAQLQYLTAMIDPQEHECGAARFGVRGRVSYMPGRFDRKRGIGLVSQGMWEQCAR